MKQTRLFLIAVLTLIASAAVAQTTTLKGILIDETSGEGEPFATVRVFKEGKTQNPASMFTTQADGSFSHDVTGRGRFDVVFSSVGKEDLKRTVTLGQGGELNLDTLYIKENATMLKGVEVVAQKPLVKMEVDKMSYNVAEDADAKASTVLDMLRKVPMVTVDGQDNISVNGSSSFKIYVDGKPNVMFQSNPSQVFKSMPASAVKSIEVVTNPGARYDAEGAAGVLNIVMNRQNPQAMQSLNGVNGSVRASAGTRSLGGSVFASGQQDKLSFSANVMENYSKPGATEMDMEQQNGTGTISTTSKSKTRLPFTMGNVSLGYDLSPMTTVSASASITNFNMKNEGTSTSSMLGGNYGQGYDYTTTTNTKNKRTSFSGSMDLQHFFNKERTQQLAVTYQLNYSPSKTEQDNDFGTASTSFVDLTDRYSLSEERTTDHTLQADYTMPVATGQKINLGSKLMTRKATSDADYYLQGVLDTHSGMDYEYRNTILAGYGEYEAKWGNLGAKAGLRYEHTWQDVEYHEGQGTDFSKDYGTLVPSASLSYSLAPTSNLGLTYNMRISRPGISYLNPYVDKSNPTALTYGNTDLDVEKSHNIALVYNMFSPKLMLNLNLHHNFTDNGIEQYSFYDGDLLNTTYGNMASRHQTGLSAYANWLVTKDTRLFLNGAVNYTKLTSNAFDTENSGWQANAMLGIQQTLPLDFKVGAYMMTSTKSYTLQGWSSGFNMLSVNLSKSLLNDKLTLSLMAMTGLSDGGNLKMETYSKGKDFLNHSSIKVPMSGVTFSVSYNFGNSKRQAKQHINRVQNDYIEQKSQGEMLNSVGNMEQ
jgi:outer membrane receptor protein involved in Fe transport